MWDLQSIIQQNNQAAINAMMTGQVVEEAQAPQPESWPLSLMAEKLRIGPPLLSELLNGFVDIDTMQGFLKLVRTFLPEHEEAIMSQPRGRRSYKFCYLFGKRYFPLPGSAREASMKELASAMPLEIKGMAYSAYHDLDIRRGYALLLSLVVYPYEGDDRDMEDDDVPFNPFDPMARYDMEQKWLQIAEDQGKKSEWRPKRSDIAWVKQLVSTLADGGKWIAPMGFTIIKINDRNIELRQADNTPEVKETVHRTVLIAQKAGIKVKVKVGRTAEEKQGKTLVQVFNGGRVPLIDLVRQLVGEELALRIPRDGWTRDELHSMTDGTKYDGVGQFADWAMSETGYVVLDSNYDGVDFMEGWGEPVFKWTKRNVELLAGEWPKVKQIRRKIDHMVEWLEASPMINFRELLEFLLAKAAAKPKGKKKAKRRSIYDPGEHMCVLDQEYDSEDDE